MYNEFFIWNPSNNLRYLTGKIVLALETTGMSVHLLDQVVDAHLAGVELDVVSVLYTPKLASVALLPLSPKVEPVYSVAPLSHKLPNPQSNSGEVHVLKVTSTIPPI